METKNLKQVESVSWKKVQIGDESFWGKRQKLNREVTLPAEYDQCKTTGRIDVFKQKYKPGCTDVPHPHQYWDSDVAKWIEAVAYDLTYRRDEELEQIIDSIIDDMEKAQWPDGYLNSYFSTCDPEGRWTLVQFMHELYCCGHMIEAAVAYYEATGKRKYLDIMCRYADHVDTVFGPGENQLHGYPGHPEIELALIKLYRCTGEERYLKLSEYFINERGTQPHFFDWEMERKGWDPEHIPPIGEYKNMERFGRNYFADGAYARDQAHKPIREQKDAVGHAVCNMYLMCGATDVAAETGDQSLLDAMHTLWDSVTLRRMYITGGIGSCDAGERFTFDYDLPNENAYNETCASIGLVFWADRMLQFGADRKYSDIMEKALYNGIISGLSLSGDHFFYANHLASNNGIYQNKVQRNNRMRPDRQQWFRVSCCPPNLARLTASIGGYIYSQNEKEIDQHLFIDSCAELQVAGEKVQILQKTEYPWDEKVHITINPENPCEFVYAVRIQGWCGRAQVRVNGEEVDVYSQLEKGYLKLRRTWKSGDTIDILLPMDVQRMEAHPSVRMDCGKIALTCGPIVYCLEEEDNGKDIFDIAIPKESKLYTEYRPDLLGGVRVIKGLARRRNRKDWEGYLYRTETDDTVECEITAIPYYTWSNRTVGEMEVWIRQS